MRAIGWFDGRKPARSYVRIAGRLPTITFSVSLVAPSPRATATAWATSVREALAAPAGVDDAAELRRIAVDGEIEVAR